MSTLMIRFILPFSLLNFLLLFSQSLPTSSATAAADGGGEGVVLVPFKRVLLSQQLPANTGGDQKVMADHDDVPDFDGHLRHKLGIHVRKARSGGGGVATRARGKTSSSAVVVQTQFSSSLLACSCFLALILF